MSNTLPDFIHRPLALLHRQLTSGTHGRQLHVHLSKHILPWWLNGQVNEQLTPQ